MMERLEERGQRIGEAGVRRAVDRLAAKLGEERGVRVEVGEDRVSVSGRGLWRRLRWIGGMLK